MSALREVPIAINELADEGLSPPAWGRFNQANELIFAIVTLPDGRSRAWSRESNEDAEIFAARIVRDVLESVGRCVLVA